MKPEVEDALSSFQEENTVTSKGPLSVVLQLTRAFRIHDFPLDPLDFVTSQGGQVKGLSGSKTRKILVDYGETRPLSSEGGRTSRGSLGLMRSYIALLNELYRHTDVDLIEIEGWWAKEAKRYLDSDPFVFERLAGESLTSALSRLLDKAKVRQDDRPGSTIQGTVLQHLIGAKIELILGNEAPTIHHHSASTADTSTSRSGDFVFGRTVIHVTTLVGPALVQKIRTNLLSDRRPLVITLASRFAGARDTLQEERLLDKVDMNLAENYLAFNSYEWGKFDLDQSVDALERLLAMYNLVVAQAETDLSLRIDFE